MVNEVKIMFPATMVERSSDDLTIDGSVHNTYCIHAEAHQSITFSSSVHNPRSWRASEACKSKKSRHQSRHSMAALAVGTLSHAEDAIPRSKPRLADLAQ